MHEHRGIASVVSVHGAGSGPEIFAPWSDVFPDSVTRSIDLHERLDVSRASMLHFANAVVREGRKANRPVAVVAWSMGGLAAMMAASELELACLVLLEPSASEEIQGRHPDVPLDTGTFDPELVYGEFPRPESSLARAERKRGISVPGLGCPSLLIYGREFAEERGRRLAAFYGSDELSFPDLSHFDLVRNAEVRRASSPAISGSID